MATKRSYGEACRFAHALDLVGERWALLVVRELLLGPKRFTDLRDGPAPRQLQHPRRAPARARAGRRHPASQAAAAGGVQVYELTEWGAELEPVVTQLGAWGARSPFPPDSGRSAPTRSSSPCARSSTPRRRAS